MRVTVGPSQRLRGWTRGNVFFLILVFLSGTWIAERTSITTLVAYLPQTLWLLPSIALILACFLRKERRLLWVNLGLLVGFGWLLAGFTVSGVWAMPDTVPFKVLTFNIKHGEGGWDKIRRLIEKEQPYIVCLQEANQIRGGSVDQLRGYHCVQADGLVIASREPLRDVRNVPLSSATPRALVATAGNGVRVVTVQLASFSVERVARQNPLKVPGHLQTVAFVHRRQIERLLSEFGDLDNVILCGDFNGPPRGEMYRMITKRFTDAFSTAGLGTGYTYPSDWPLLRIDYAFTRGVMPSRANVLGANLSDHRPVLFEMYQPT